MNAHFVAGFFDELEKAAAAGGAKGSLLGRAAKSGLKAVGAAGKHVGGALWPWLLLGGIPAAVLTERAARGFGRGVAEAADRPMSHER